MLARTAFVASEITVTLLAYEFAVNTSPFPLS